jgi:hypothetical protein
MNSADIALAVFTACNSVRVFAYLPQLMKIGRDTEGAIAISYSTWGMFSLSHMSTVAYAIVVVQDWKMACVFAANTLCCSAILALTAFKRRDAKRRHGCSVGVSRSSRLLRVGPPSARLATLRVVATLATTVTVL